MKGSPADPRHGDTGHPVPGPAGEGADGEGVAAGGTGSRETDRVAPVTTDSVEPASGRRHELPKAPLVVLAGVVGALLVMLTGQIVLTGAGPDAAGTGQEQDRRTVAHREQPAQAGLGPGRATGGSAQDVDEVGGSDDDRGYLIRTVADGFEQDFAGVVSESEARCMASVVLEVLGVDRLWDLTEVMAEHAADPEGFDRDDPRLLSPAELDQLNQALRPCVSPEVADRLDFG